MSKEMLARLALWSLAVPHVQTSRLVRFIRQLAESARARGGKRATFARRTRRDLR